MRILSINKFYYLSGGSERYMFGLNQLLEESGHTVIPFAMAHPENMESQYSPFFVSRVDYSSSSSLVTKVKAALKVIYSREAEREIEKLIKETNPQIAHLHNVAHQLSPSILYALQRNNVPIIQTLHDYKLVCPVYTMYTHDQVCERCLNGQYYNVVRHRCNKNSIVASAINMVEMYTHTMLRSYDKVHAFISPSVFLMNKMIEGGISSDRIHHIPNFIDACCYAPHYRNDGYLLFLGQLTTVKGLDIVLQALQHLPKIHLIVAGRGPEKERFESFAQKHNLRVTFVGFQSGNDLKELIQNSLVVVVPSVWYENFPYAILEAFAYGKPVIASRLGGMAELVSDDETGYLFSPGSSYDLSEKISKALSNSTKMMVMGKAAREKVERELNPVLHLEKIVRLYKQLIKD